MSITSSMLTGVAGLSAQARAVAKVAENVANVGTTGYKRGFAAMVTTTGGGSSIGGGVKATLDADVRIEGTKMTTSSATDFAISGEGMFLVSPNPNDPIESNYVLTRTGNFKPDENGNLKNAAGYFLAAFPSNPDGTLPAVDYTSVASVRTVNVADQGVTAEQTTRSSLSGNLPSDETGTGEVVAPFNTTMRYTNSLGGSERITLSWQASDTTKNLWTLSISGPDGTAFGTVDVTFDDSGATPGAPSSFTGTADPALPPPAAFVANPDGTVEITINNGATPQTITIDLGGVGTYDGVTQFASDFNAQKFDTNGSEATTLASTEVDDKGIMWGVYQNGERKALYQIPVATVPNFDALNLVDGNAYQVNRFSGNMMLNLSGTGSAGSIDSFSLEQSNVDIAQEMTNLIQVQRHYSSNAKIIQTADEMLQETTNLKR